MMTTMTTDKDLDPETQKATADAVAALTAFEPIMRWFAFAHLPPKLASVSCWFAVLAVRVTELPRSAERTVALRKLLEGKDAAVRAAMAEAP